MNNNNDDDPPPTAHRPRESLLPSSQRWVTNLYTNSHDEEEPPIDNPANSPETNAQLRKEYQSLRKLNQTLETVINSFKNTQSNFEQFAQTVDQTDQLLELWTNILSQSDVIKQQLDHPSHQASGSLPSSSQMQAASPSRPSVTEPQHAPPPKRLKRSTSNTLRRH